MPLWRLFVPLIWDIRVSEIKLSRVLLFVFFTHKKEQIVSGTKKEKQKTTRFNKLDIGEFNIRHVLMTSASVPWEDISYRWYESWLWWWRRWQPSCGFWSTKSLGGAEKRTRTSPRRWSWSDTPSRAENPGRYPQCSCLSATSTTSRGQAWRHGPGNGCWPHRKKRCTCRRPGTDRTGRGSSGPSDLHRREEIDILQWLQGHVSESFPSRVGRILPEASCTMCWLTVLFTARLQYDWTLVTPSVSQPGYRQIG